MKVDWDVHSGSEVAKEHGVRQRATLVMLSGGGEEIGRVNWKHEARGHRGPVQGRDLAA